MSYYTNPGVGNPRFPYKSFFSTIPAIAPSEYSYNERDNNLFTVRSFADSSGEIFLDFVSMGPGTLSNVNTRFMMNYGTSNAKTSFAMTRYGPEDSDINFDFPGGLTVNGDASFTGNVYAPIIYVKELRNYDSEGIAIKSTNFLYLGDSDPVPVNDILPNRLYIQGSMYSGIIKTLFLGIGNTTGALNNNLDVRGDAFFSTTFNGFFGRPETVKIVGSQYISDYLMVTDIVGTNNISPVNIRSTTYIGDGTPSRSELVQVDGSLYVRDGFVASNIKSSTNPNIGWEFTNDSVETTGILYVGGASPSRDEIVQIDGSLYVRDGLLASNIKSSTNSDIGFEFTNNSVETTGILYVGDASPTRDEIVQIDGSLYVRDGLVGSNLKSDRIVSSLNDNVYIELTATSINTLGILYVGIGSPPRSEIFQVNDDGYITRLFTDRIVSPYNDNVYLDFGTTSINTLGIFYVGIGSPPRTEIFQVNDDGYITRLFTDRVMNPLDSNTYVSTSNSGYIRVNPRLVVGGNPPSSGELLEVQGSLIADIVYSNVFGTSNYAIVIETDRIKFIPTGNILGKTITFYDDGFVECDEVGRKSGSSYVSLNTDNIIVTVSTSEIARFTSTGVGIKTSSISYPLDVNGIVRTNNVIISTGLKAENNSSSILFGSGIDIYNQTTLNYNFDTTGNLSVQSSIKGLSKNSFIEFNLNEIRMYGGPNNYLRISENFDQLDFFTLGGVAPLTVNKTFFAVTYGIPRILVTNTKTVIQNNVGIGIAEPLYALDVVGTIRTSNLIIGDGFVNVLGSGVYDISTAMVIAFQGQRRFEISDFRIEVNISRIEINAFGSALNTNLAEIYFNAATVSSYISNNQTGTGAFIIGTNSTNSILFIGNGGVRMIVPNDGRVIATEFIETSDRRLKERITDLSDDESLRIVKGLKPVKFYMKSSPDVLNYGFVAQDVEEVCPEMVRETESSIPVNANVPVKEEGGRKYVERNEELSEFDLTGVFESDDSKEIQSTEVTSERIYFDLDDDVYELNIKKMGIKNLKTLRKNMIIPTLVSAVQSLTDKVESLTARLTALENMSSN